MSSRSAPSRARLAGAAALALGLATALHANPALASDPRDESRAAFLRGVSEAHRDHFTAARDAFLEAYRLFPHPSILLNLGVARMHTGEYVAAEECLSRFLVDDGGAGPDDLANARATLAVVRKHLGTLRIRVTPDGARGTLDGASLPLVPGAFVEVRAVTGPAELRVEATGYRPDVRQILVAHDDNAPVDVALVRRAAGDAPDASGSAGDAPVRHAVLGWSLLGGGAALAAVGTVAGVEAISLAHDYNTPGASGYQERSTKSSGVAWRTSADALFATAIGLGAVGTYLLVRPLHAQAAQALVGPTSCGVRVRF